MAQIEPERTLNLADEVVRHKVVVVPPPRSRRVKQLATSPASAGGGDATPQGSERTMATDNQVTLVGNLTDDPELRYAQRRGGLQAADRREPAVPGPERAVEGRRHVVLHRERVADAGGERGRVARPAGPA